MGTSLGFGAGFGTVDCLNMLAQVVFVAAGAGAVAGFEAAVVGLGAAAVGAGVVSVAVGSLQAVGSSMGCVFHSAASSVGTDRGSVFLT